LATKDVKSPRSRGTATAKNAPKWSAVADFVNQRMADLGLSQVEVARAAGVSDVTVRRLQRGEPGNYRPAILAKVSLALRGRADSIERVLAGDSPSLADAPTTTGGIDDQAVLARLAALEARLSAVEQRVVRYGGSADAG